MLGLGTGRKLLGVLLPVLAGVALAPLPDGGSARADIIPLVNMMAGIPMTPQQCSAKPLTVWINTSVGGYCMRYYLSTVGGDGRWATVFLQGDKLGRRNPRTRTLSGSPKDKDVDTDELQRTADAFSRKTRGPAIYLARIGIDGSSGHHVVRHSMLELEVTNAALTGIKLLHRYEGFHLAGQSGGATLVGGLLALRQDIGCAVPGSGRLAAVTRRRTRSSDPAMSDIDPSAMHRTIAGSRARILVVTDPQDRKVPLPHQTAFVETLRLAGGQAEQFFVQAVDDDHHGTVAYSRAAVAACIRGDDNQAIARELAELVRVRVATAQRAKDNKLIVPPQQPPAPAISQVAPVIYPQHRQGAPTIPSPAYRTQVPTAHTVDLPQRPYQVGRPQYPQVPQAPYMQGPKSQAPPPPAAPPAQLAPSGQRS